MRNQANTIMAIYKGHLHNNIKKIGVIRKIEGK